MEGRIQNRIPISIWVIQVFLVLVEGPMFQSVHIQRDSGDLYASKCWFQWFQEHEGIYNVSMCGEASLGMGVSFHPASYVKYLIGTLVVQYEFLHFDWSKPVLTRSHCEELLYFKDPRDHACKNIAYICICSA